MSDIESQSDRGIAGLPAIIETLEYLLHLQLANGSQGLCHRLRWFFTRAFTAIFVRTCICSLRSCKAEYGFELVVRDVDADPDWASAYGDEVPLLFAEDVEICRHFLDLERLKAQIDP